MTYEEKKKVVEAAMVLKVFCANNRDCMVSETEDCPFYSSIACKINALSPRMWEIPDISRWTPEDVALAKALKAFGAIFLEKERSGAITVHFNNGDLCEAPVLAFKCMPDGSYHIDNIIKEAEG